MATAQEIENLLAESLAGVASVSAGVSHPWMVPGEHLCKIKDCVIKKKRDTSTWQVQVTLEMVASSNPICTPGSMWAISENNAKFPTYYQNRCKQVLAVFEGMSPTDPKIHYEGSDPVVATATSKRVMGRLAKYLSGALPFKDTLVRIDSKASGRLDKNGGYFCNHNMSVPEAGWTPKTNPQLAAAQPAQASPAPQAQPAESPAADLGDDW
jgi:hypothetical protein